MDMLYGFLLNYLFLSPVIGWLLACAFKAVLAAIRKKARVQLKDGFSNGGMPSTHTAFVTNFTAAIALTQGFTPLFFACVIFSLVIISDSFGVRKNIGMQGDALNALLKKLKKDPINVVYGHSFVQVLAGMLWGVLSALILYSILI